RPTAIYTLSLHDALPIWFAQYELLELGRSREQADSVGDERHRLVVPKPAVEVQLLQMRKRWKPRQLVLQSPRAHRHADEIQHAEDRKSTRLNSSHVAISY